MSGFFALIRWEFVRVLRDANTLLYFGFPVLAYPLLLWAMLQGVTVVETENARQELRLVVSDPADRVILAKPPKPTKGAKPTANGGATLFVEGDLAALDAGEVDAIVVRDGDTVTITHRGGSARSRNAVARVKERLFADLVERREEAAEALDVTLVELEIEDLGGSSVGTWMFALFAGITAPATLVISASFPLAELFVVEREKHTLETLLTTSVSRIRLVLARVLVACLLGTTAAVANVVGMGVLVTAGIATLSERFLDATIVPSWQWALVPVVLFSTSLVVTAVLAVLFSFAQTFRESQTLYSFAVIGLLGGPMMGVFATMGGWAEMLAPFPLAHSSPLLSGAISGSLTPFPFLLGLLTDVGMAAVLLFGWSWLFGNESLLRGVSRPAWLTGLLGGET